MKGLIDGFIAAGLVQFGSFRRGEHDVPLQTSFEMLASYPDLLHQVAASARETAGSHRYEHLLCPFDTLPFGVALSLAMGVPLVYSRGSGEALVHDLVGAYDIGHATLLISNTDSRQAASLAAAARRVGLDVRSALVILRVKNEDTFDVPTAALLDLPTLIETLRTSGQLPPGQADAVMRWAGG